MLTAFSLAKIICFPNMDESTKARTTSWEDEIRSTFKLQLYLFVDFKKRSCSFKKIIELRVSCLRATGFAMERQSQKLLFHYKEIHAKHM